MRAKVVWLPGLVALVLSVQAALVGSALAASGWTAYVASCGDDTVRPINTATNTAGTPITGFESCGSVAITPDGKTAYVANGFDAVTPIDTATNTAGTPIPVGSGPEKVAITRTARPPTSPTTKATP
jgi:YVTN family beta-propeller protein